MHGDATQQQRLQLERHSPQRRNGLTVAVDGAKRMLVGADQLNRPQRGRKGETAEGEGQRAEPSSNPKPAQQAEHRKRAGEAEPHGQSGEQAHPGVSAVGRGTSGPQAERQAVQTSLIVVSPAKQREPNPSTGRQHHKAGEQCSR